MTGVCDEVIRVDGPFENDGIVYLNHYLSRESWGIENRNLACCLFAKVAETQRWQ